MHAYTTTACTCMNATHTHQQCCKLLSKIIKEGRFLLKSRKITWGRRLEGKRLWNKARGQLKSRLLLQKWAAQRRTKKQQEDEDGGDANAVTPLIMADVEQDVGANRA